MPPQEAGYQMAQAMVAMWDAVAPIAGPILLLIVLLGFFNWISSIPRGRD